MDDAKPYCRVGESDSNITVAWVVLSIVTFFLALVAITSLFL